MTRDDEQRIIVDLSRRLVDRIEDFRFGHRLPSRVAAIRRLIETGLRHEKPPDPTPSRR